MGFDERILNGMGVLSAIIDSGSFVRAGEILDMSQSGVSRAVARLEARMGIRLFDRTTRSVMLTDEGRRFYERIAPLLAGLEEAATDAAQGTTAVRGRLRLNVDPYFSRLALGPRLGAFLEAHPALQLEVVTRDQLGDMIADGFDLAVRFGQPQASTLVSRTLLRTRVVTVAAPVYLRRHGRPTKPEELADGRHTCLQFRNPQTGRAFEWEFHRDRRKIVLEPKGQLMLNDAGTLLSVCQSGHGIAQIFELGSEHLLANGRLVDLFPDWPDERYPLHALYPSRHHVPAKTRAFLDFVASLASQHVAS